MVYQISSNLQRINPLDILLWTLRRNQKDVIKLYNTLSRIMQLVTGDTMLNFGYWDSTVSTPLEAQQKLCDIFGNFSKLQRGQLIVDTGSGYGAPAALWQKRFGPANIISLNINHLQLYNDSCNGGAKLRLNATANMLPFVDSSVDRVLAFESAQHFKPLSNFICESYRILKNDGIATFAIPVLSQGMQSTSLLSTLFNSKIGLLLSLTWSSEHYSQDFVVSEIEKSGFKITSLQRIGCNVYMPIANYYYQNRATIRKALSKTYPWYVEKILFRSIKEMHTASQKGVIDYLLISCKK